MQTCLCFKTLKKVLIWGSLNIPKTYKPITKSVCMYVCVVHVCMCACVSLELGTRPKPFEYQANTLLLSTRPEESSLMCNAEVLLLVEGIRPSLFVYVYTRGHSHVRFLGIVGMTRPVETQAYLSSAEQFSGESTLRNYQNVSIYKVMGLWKEHRYKDS